MGGRRWLIAGVVASLLAGSGCISCGSKGYGLALEAGPTCEFATCQRDRVYVFAVSGLNPVSMFALDGLRESLNRQGYAKVATAPSVYAGWMAAEMRRIHVDRPDAVFVVVGYESGGPTAVKLAEKAATDGMTIGGVVLIDSEGKTAAPASAIRTLAVGSVYGLGSSGEVTSVVIPDAGWYKLPSDDRTVAAILAMLHDSTATIPLPAVEEVGEWSYPLAPPMRPTGNPVRDPDWIYLFDQHGGSTELRNSAGNATPPRTYPYARTATRVQ